jgi:glycosyltransferase involved in cell wall biosynthesis
MSPVGVNKTLIQHQENGFLVDSQQEWYDTLAYLLENRESRIRIGQKGDDTVENFYSVEVTKWKYLKIFESMCQ